MEYLFLSVGLIYLSELGAYFWHRYGTHEDYIPNLLGVQETHKKHHTIIEDLAHGDFFYVAIFLLFFALFLIYLYYIKVISFLLILSIYIPIFIASLYSYFIHSAYHIDDHWLLKYEWFRNDKRIHFHHHKDQTTNYGIATHFCDVIFDTFNYGLLSDI